MGDAVRIRIWRRNKVTEKFSDFERIRTKYLPNVLLDQMDEPLKIEYYYGLENLWRGDWRYKNDVPESDAQRVRTIIDWLDRHPTANWDTHV